VKKFKERSLSRNWSFRL